MDIDGKKVRSDVDEDRLSGLPDELIHQILYRFDTKFAVRTCVLSSRWKLIWKSIPRLDLSSQQFKSLPKFAKFVTHVLSHRNHQTDVLAVKLHFHGAASQVFVRKIANYVFSHNVQELTVISWTKKHHEFPPCFFNSQTLRHLTFSNPYFNPCLTPKTPWDFPALTTLHLSEITLCDKNCKYIDLFSKCLNLKSLTLENFEVWFVEVFDIITPRLSNLMLIRGRRLNVVNVIAPQLENLMVSECSINYLNAPPEISSLYYKGRDPPQWFKDSFHSVKKVYVSLSYFNSRQYNEENVHETIKMLQELRNAKLLTLGINIIECISSLPDLLSCHPSPFRNLISLDIDSSMRSDAYKVKMSIEARNFFLENSPNATFIMELPEPPPTKAMKAKAAREKKNAELVADIESRMMELQASVEQGNMNLVERKQVREKAKVTLEELQVLTNIRRSEPERVQSDEVDGLIAQIKVHLREMHDHAQQDNEAARSILRKKIHIEVLLEMLPKLRSKEMVARYPHQLEEAESLADHHISEFSFAKLSIEFIEEQVSGFVSVFQKISGSKLSLSSQPSSSEISPASIPSASNINPMP